ncbi:hypothetical protein RUND412_007227 [Rhizina undulata]
MESSRITLGLRPDAKRFESKASGSKHMTVEEVRDESNSSEIDGHLAAEKSREEAKNKEVKPRVGPVIVRTPVYTENDEPNIHEPEPYSGWQMPIDYSRWPWNVLARPVALPPPPNYFRPISNATLMTFQNPHQAGPSHLNPTENFQQYRGIPTIPTQPPPPGLVGHGCTHPYYTSSPEIPLDFPNYPCSKDTLRCATCYRGGMNSWKSVSCPGCGPKTTIRYCSDSCQFNDCRHWQVCRLQGNTHTTSQYSIIKNFPVRPCARKHMTADLYYQALCLWKTPIVDYFIFSYDRRFHRPLPQYTLTILDMEVCTRFREIRDWAILTRDEKCVVMMARIIVNQLEFKGVKIDPSSFALQIWREFAVNVAPYVIERWCIKYEEVDEVVNYCQKFKKRGLARMI